MRAIYLDEDNTQLVLTPENEWERNILRMISQDMPEPKTYWGEFYACRGGWIRMSDTNSKASLIIRLQKQSELPVEAKEYPEIHPDSVLPRI